MAAGVVVQAKVVAASSRAVVAARNPRAAAASRKAKAARVASPPPMPAMVAPSRKASMHRARPAASPAVTAAHPATTTARA